MRMYLFSRLLLDKGYVGVYSNLDQIKKIKLSLNINSNEKLEILKGFDLLKLLVKSRPQVISTKEGFLLENMLTKGKAKEWFWGDFLLIEKFLLRRGSRIKLGMDIFGNVNGGLRNISELANKFLQLNYDYYDWKGVIKITIIFNENDKIKNRLFLQYSGVY